VAGAILAAGILDAAAGTPPETPPSQLNWRVAEGRVNAHIEGWPLQKLLREIAAKTHWQVFVQPEASHVVSAKFKDLKPGEALRRLLGTLNFALVPSTNGPSRLYVFQNSLQAATERVLESELGSRRSKRILDELVVTLKPDAGVTIDQLATALGAQVTGRLDPLHTYRLKFPSESAAEAARATLAREGGVDGFDGNYAFDRPVGSDGSPIRSSTPFNLRPRSGGDADGVVVALVDTAVQTDGTVLGGFLLPGVSVAGPSQTPTDQLTHGTSMAQTLLYALAGSTHAAEGTAVRLLPVDVYGPSASTTTFDFANGIYEAIHRGADIVNLSLGGDQESPLIRSLIKAGREQGVVFIAAAGNEPVSTPTYPAAYPEVIAVTASDRTGGVAAYANRGAFVDLIAPGTSRVPFQGQDYWVVGTSAATAMVSARAAALAESTGQRGAALEALLRGTTGPTVTP